MLTARATYLLLLLCTGICFLLYPAYLFHLLFLLVLLLPALSLLLTLPLLFYVRAEVSFPQSEAQKGTVPITFSAVNTSLLPCPYVMFQMRYQNVLGKSRLQIFQYQKERVRFTVGPRDTASVAVTFRMPYCGKTDMELLRVSVCDMLGLFSLPLRHVALGRSALYILPAASALTVLAAPSPAAHTEGDLYSSRRAGQDTTEIFQLRDYAAGDRLRDVHWKLSARMDTLITKEYGQPLVPSVHFLLELQDGVETAAADKLLCLFYSFALQLSMQGIVYRVSFLPHGQVLESKLVVSAQALLPLLHQLLALPGVKPWLPMEQLMLFGSADPGCHLVYLAAGVVEGLADGEPLKARMSALLTENRFHRATVFLDSAPAKLTDALQALGCKTYALRDEALQKEVFEL